MKFRNKKSLGFTVVPSLFLVVGLCLLAFYFGKKFVTKTTVPTPNSAKYYQTYYSPFPTTDTTESEPTYKSSIYMSSADSSEPITNDTILPSKYIGGPVNPIFDTASNNIFYASGSAVFEYNLLSKTKSEIYNAGKTQTINLLSFKKLDKLYVTESKISYGFSESLTLVEINVVTKAKKVIGSQKPVMYGNLQYIGNSDGLDIVATFGGDGCGGYGEIYSIKDDLNKLLVKTGVGCSPNPRYIGFSNDLKSVITASIKNRSDTLSPDALPEDRFEFIYLTNIITGEKKAIYTRIKDSFAYFVMSNTKNIVYLISSNNKKIYAFDLDSFGITNEVSISDEIQDYYTVSGGLGSSNTVLVAKWSGYVGDKKQYKLLDLDTGNIITSYSIPNLGPSDPIGIFNDRLLTVSYSGSNY